MVINQRAASFSLACWAISLFRNRTAFWARAGHGQSAYEEALQAQVVRVDAHTDINSLGLGADRLQARRNWHLEDVGHGVVVALLQRLRIIRRIGKVEFAVLVREGGQELRVPLVNGIADVLEEDKAENNVLLLGGIHTRAQLVGSSKGFLEVLIHRGRDLSRAHIWALQILF
jgi:hypothetical protein